MDFKNYTPYKYVRLSTDELRFTESSSVLGLQHFQLVNKGERAISAGLIMVWTDKFTVLDTGSMSLKIRGTMGDDTELIEKVTGLKFKERDG